MLKNYILVNRTPVPEPNVLRWAYWFERADRRVALTRVWDTWEVSTVFLGIDHRWRDGDPLLFESMAFGPGVEHQNRCSNWAQAEAMHEDMVREVGSLRSVVALVVSTWRATVAAARADWKAIRKA